MSWAVAEFLLCCLASFVCSSVQQTDTAKPNFNSTKDGVVELTQKNIKTLVLNSNDIWLVDFEFSGTGCSYCIAMSQLIKKAVPLLKAKKIKVGYVSYNSPDGRKLIEMYGITGFPTLYIFGNDKEYPLNFRPYATNSPEEFARSVEFNANRSRPAEGVCASNSGEDSDIYELTDDNFDEVVMGCEEPWVVNFYVPDIPLCMQFQPFFTDAAKEFKGKAKFGSLFQLGSAVAAKYGVTAVCTVKLFSAGDKSAPPIDFNNGTHSSSIDASLGPWLRNALATNQPPPSIHELTSQGVLDSNCKDASVDACIFIFLANSDKCDDQCRQTYLDNVTMIANDMKGQNWAWFWTTQDKQPAFEKTLGIQYFPGVSAVDRQSKTFSTNRGTTSAKRLKEFLTSFSNGLVPSKPMTDFPAVKE